MTRSHPPRRPADASLVRVLDTLIRLEERAARLYSRFYQRFRTYPPVAAAWWDMAMDEYGHAGILRAVQNLVEPTRGAGELAPRVRPLVRILRECERRGAGNVSIRVALDLAITIETSELDRIGNEVIRSLKHDLPEVAQRAFGSHDAHLQRLTRAVGKFGDEAMTRRVTEIRRRITAPRG